MSKNKPLILFDLKKNGRCRISIDGSVPDLLAGVLSLAKSIYHQILINGDEAGAEWFLKELGEAMINPDSPLYEEVR